QFEYEYFAPGAKSSGCSSISRISESRGRDSKNERCGKYGSPEECERSCASVSPRVAGGASGRKRPRLSETASFPSASSARIAAAVNCLESEPSRNGLAADTR